MKRFVGAVEVGGTTAAVAVADKIHSEFLYKKKGIPVHGLSPAQAVKNIAEQLIESGYKLDIIGICTFGPVSMKTGSILTTPKPLWANFPLVDEFRKYFPKEIPIVLETDVNAPAFSEYIALKEKDPSVDSVAYITIGTGVGIGVYSDGRPYHGIMHPEFGHFLVRKREGDNFQGTCPFHGDCLEGLISAGALAKRIGIDPSQLKDVPNEDPAWDYFAEYIGQACANYALAYSLDHIMIGGGIATGDNRSWIFEKIREYCQKTLNGYISMPSILPPIFNKDAGLYGAAAIGFHPESFSVFK